MKENKNSFLSQAWFIFCLSHDCGGAHILIQETLVGTSASPPPRGLMSAWIPLPLSLNLVGSAPVTGDLNPEYNGQHTGYEMTVNSFLHWLRYHLNFYNWNFCASNLLDRVRVHEPFRFTGSTTMDMTATRIFVSPLLFAVLSFKNYGASNPFLIY